VRRKSLTLLYLLPVTVASVSLASCDLSSPTGPPVGGPAGDGPRALSGQITLHESDGTKDIVPVGANGRFSVPIAVGTYTVSGRSPQYAGGTAVCQASGPAVVTKGVTSSVEVYCLMS
jgi:hypothetical protein